MHTTRLSSKGQIIIPKAVRDAHGWVEGTEFVVEDGPEGMVLRPKAKTTSIFKPTKLEDVIGCARYNGPPKSLEQIDAELEAAMRDQFSREYRRGSSK